MSPRQRRIDRILGHRKKELDARVAVLAEVRTREAAAMIVADRARDTALGAEEAKRQLALHGSDVQAFIEAEEWRASTALASERAWIRVASLRSEAERAQTDVLSARMKLKQAEQLVLRVANAEDKIVNRRERRRDDETAARIAVRFGAAASDK